MSKIAACTIVSRNYISYAKTLGDSFKINNPDKDFYILLVDKYDVSLDQYVCDHTLIEVTELNIKNFSSIAFMFDVLELNTNVKPTFLKYLLKIKKYEKVLYFDPDIYIYQDVMAIIDKLEKYSIVVTPHCNSPYPEDEFVPNEQSLLHAGVFNLGFIAVSNKKDAIDFLTWWEHKCLSLGFNEVRNGLFVDQKWVNFIPCFSDSVYILKDCACNVAYWNLHERVLTKKNNKYIVNDVSELIFFHFSGVDASKSELLSKHQNRYNFDLRKDLVEIFDKYRRELLKNKIVDSSRNSYYYSTYSNGKIISSLVRRLYSVHKEQFVDTNPFDVDSDFYKWVKGNHLIGESDMSGKYNSNNYRKDDIRLTILHGIFKLLLRVFGVDKYTMLVKYLSFISILRNQKEIFKVEKG